MTGLRGSTVLVTGAAGFIGSRLVEQLVQEGARVRALLRSGIQSPQFTFPGCEPIRGDVTLPDSLIPAVKGCRVVFHCAFGEGSLDASRRVNVEGTLNILREACRAETRRVVFTSSIAVHGTGLSGVIDESQPFVTQGNPYEISKAEAERSALEFGRRNGIEVVIIRPTLVYGPASPNWTLRLLQRVKFEKIRLVGGGQGIANLVYIDDVVQSLMLAATTSGADGEAFFISGSDPGTWRELLAKYAQMLEKPLPPSLSLWRANLLYHNDLWKSRLIQSPMRVELFDLIAQVQTARFSIKKAERQLGFRPRFDFASGMENTENWLRRSGYLPPAKAF